MNETANYSAPITSLLAEPRLPELGPGTPNYSMRAALASLTPETAFPNLRDRSMALSCIAGLWLLHDFLDESHTISQELPSPTGSYWHGIMHRREPDAPNSKYWFRHMGHHPVVDRLITEATKIGYSYRNPAGFVDFCGRVRGTGSADEDLARRVQLLEWRLLFEWCWHRASIEVRQ